MYIYILICSLLAWLVRERSKPCRPGEPMPGKIYNSLLGPSGSRVVAFGRLPGDGGPNIDTRMFDSQIRPILHISIANRFFRIMPV